MITRAYLSIGDVLTLLREEFPDVTISKIRFLESQGLVNPERSPSGYRKFYEQDVERLRWVLRQQREHFLPLKVIRDRLAQEDGAPAEESDPPASIAALLRPAAAGTGAPPMPTGERIERENGVEPAARLVALAPDRRRRGLAVPARRAAAAGARPPGDDIAPSRCDRRARFRRRGAPRARYRCSTPSPPPDGGRSGRADPAAPTAGASASRPRGAPRRRRAAPAPSSVPPPAPAPVPSLSRRPSPPPRPRRPPCHRRVRGCRGPA